MQNSELQKELNKIWEGRVQTLDFDPLNRRIQFKIKFYRSGGGINIVSLIFFKVSAFYFVNEIANERFNIYEPDEGDSKELTSIYWYPNGVGEIKIVTNPSAENVNWAKQWYSSANFAIDLEPSILLIEAQTVSIDGKTFDVGLPTDYS